MFAADTHTHLYPVFDRERFFRAAARNAAAAARAAGVDLEGLVLCLTEGDDAGAFDGLRDTPAAGAGGLRFSATPEPVSLRVEGLELPVFVIRGRQIVTAEGLEVLAIGIAAPGPDRALPLADVIVRVAAGGGWPIVPWGAGKWWGRRGAALRAAMARDGLPPFALGDNGGRPWFWPAPRAFRRAAARGIAVVPGSDPLPIAGEEATAGRGLALAATPLDAAAPAACLVRALATGALAALSPAGRETAGRFVRNQFRMQRRKRGRR